MEPIDDCIICQRVELARAGGNPLLIHEFKNSYLVLGDHQYFKGYCVVQLKEHVREMHELSAEIQAELMKELMSAGRAVFDTFQPWKMNYSCYGNAVEHIHWHIFPRYESDPDHRVHPWLHMTDFDQYRPNELERKERIERIRATLRG